MLSFYALPGWALTPAHKQGPGEDPAELLIPAFPEDQHVVTLALGTTEFAGARASVRAERAVSGSAQPHAVFARPPNDLPALLRLADELVRVARQDAGEPARVWQCSCGTRYAVPIAVVVPVSLACEKCGRMVDLEPALSIGEDHIADPLQARVNECRRALSEFFREAMARGWPVLVKRA